MISAGEVIATYERLLESWNQRDSAQFSQCFGTDGVSIGFDGSTAVGREQIHEHLEPIFRDHPTAAYVAKICSVDQLSDDVALIHSMVGMVPPGSSEINPKTNALQLLVLQKSSDGWLVRSLQNTPAAYHGRPHLVDDHTAELQRVFETNQIVDRSNV